MPPVIAIDTRTYPARSVEEPDKDKRFEAPERIVETIVFNTALMRRRDRDEHLIMEMTEAGADFPHGYRDLLYVRPS